MAVLKDRAGNKYGRLLVLSAAPSRRASSGRMHSRWTCLCDCKNEIIVASEALAKGHTKSCGCLRKDFRRTPDAPLNVLYAMYRAAAHNAGRVFEIDKEDFRRLTSQNCYYCGAEPSRMKRSRNSAIYFWNGLDRVDNSVGYVLANVVPCCKICNQAKHTLTQEVFLSWIDTLVQHRRLALQEAAQKETNVTS
jgi:hypothetical protein